MSLAAGAVSAQTYVPGDAYYGRSNYTFYVAGDLPVIFSAPHGGSLTPSEIPDRVDDGSDPNYTTVTDSFTEETALAVQTVFGNYFGHCPHVIICQLKRSKIDCNRNLAQGVYNTNAAATTAWNEFQNDIAIASNSVVAQSGRGFYIDLHGQGHAIQRLEIGYLLSAKQLTNTDTRLNAPTFAAQSSIRSLNTIVSNKFGMPFSQILRGSNSFGGMMAARGFPSVPSPDMPSAGNGTNPIIYPGDQNDYFDGGYNTATHGSVNNSGPIDSLQIEANLTGVRDTATSRTNYATAIAQTLDYYFTNYYGFDLRLSAPCIWSDGTGNWGTVSHWYNGFLPVAGNYLLFNGPGGQANNNLASLTTGTGRIYSMLYATNATGSYTNTGSDISLVAGITNFSDFSENIFNNITLLGPQGFCAGTGGLIFSANIDNNGFDLTVDTDTNTSIKGIISDTGGLTKTGVGTLALTAVNTYTGPTTNLDGVISVNATSTFGDGTGLLVLAGGDILCANTRSVLPLSNSILMTADATIVGNGNLANSTRILPFSANSVTTTGGTLTIRNSSTNAVATNNVFQLRFQGGGFNFTQPIVIDDPADLPVTSSQLESFNDNVTGDETFSGPISGAGQFRRDATVSSASGRTILSGANTYAGGTFVFSGTLVVNNTSGSGTGTGVVSVSNPGTLLGNGSLAGAVTCSGLISSGQGSGALTLGGGLDLSSSGTNLWDLSSLSDVGAGTSFDQIILTGGNLKLGGSSKLQLSFTNSATAPSGTSPFWLMSHTWKIISLTGTATNSGATKFATILASNYSTGTFTNMVDASGSILLSYIATTPAKPSVQSFTLTSPGSFNLTATAETNRTYILQSTTNISTSTWTPVSTNVSPGTVLSLTNIVGGDPIRFYRVVAVP